MERIALRQRLRLVKNGSVLLRGTILDHLTQFRSDQLGGTATALCDRHGVATQILNLPRGYDTPIGEFQDFPLAAGLVFRVQVMQALMDAPAVLLVDASEVNLGPDQLAWLLGLELDASRLIAVAALPALRLPASLQMLSWQSDQFIEVQG